ncbi:hypothetical protein V5O48_012270 [Marasmius crinis-equi]|uniref:SWIM-type domain-containing protein n=1 Tax=Marasmius crinis-equi TaxID=585013 RepID=A0ABR3F3C1_9AGAR
MDSFDCNGWIHVTIFEGSDEAFITVTHEEDHVHYWRVDIPDDVRSYIEANLALKPNQLWTQITKRFGLSTTFSSKSVYAMWSELTSTEWKLDKDEVRSAKAIIEMASRIDVPRDEKQSLYEVENIPLPEDSSDGFTAVAFALVPLLRKWSGQIREISLDSAWNTNKSHFEIFALLGEVYGSGCPLGFLLIQSTPNHAEGEDGKQKYIESLLKYFKTKWVPKPLCTLTDKDRIEINAFRNCFPNADHQLCFWHCLRAIKTRLSILRRRPAPYDGQRAKAEYDFVDPEFKPLAQMTDEEIRAADLRIPTAAMPTLNVFLAGIPQSQAPPPKDHEKIMIRINGEAVREYQEKVKRGVALTLHADSENLDEAVESLDTDVDQEDGPDWMFESGETTVRDPNYTFCPAPHRKQLLHLFTRHFCQHPFFPNRQGEKRTAATIKRDAAWEMYSFCKKRGLREVWAYMYNSWYCSTMWPLWARSSSPYLSRLRTTMNVENFWKQLKHDQLHRLLHPRLDHLVHILIYDVGPHYINKMNALDPQLRLGRSRPPSPFQRAFRLSWNFLAAQKLREGSIQEYHTDLQTWTCRCGRQMYHRHHLCRHLVHLVLSTEGLGSPSAKFWVQVSRRRKVPLYKHSDIQGTSAALLDTGTITDGDDLDVAQSVLGKRVAEHSPVPPRHVNTPDPSTSHSRNVRPRHSEDPALDDDFDPHELLPEFPAATEDCSPVDLPEIDKSELSQSSSRATTPSNYEEDEIFEEVELAERKMLQRAADLISFGRMIQEQSALPDNPGKAAWFKSIARRDLGRDVSDAVKDIRRHENGRVRRTTWGAQSNGGHKQKAGKEGAAKKPRRKVSASERKRVANTMGYYPIQGEDEVVGEESEGENNSDGVPNHISEGRED